MRNWQVWAIYVICALLGFAISHVQTGDAARRDVTTVYCGNGCDIVVRVAEGATIAQCVCNCAAADDARSVLNRLRP